MASGQADGWWCERAFPAGSNLEVASVIREYLDRSNGDARLALAMSVANQVALMRVRHAEAVRSALSGRGAGHR